MDSSDIDMDFLIKHWAPYTRRCEPQFRLISSDFIKRKSARLAATFDTCNFSLILRGRGSFVRNAVTHGVVAPCVITQWPGESLEYGPEPGTWDEWYLIFARTNFSKFQLSGFIDTSRPVWPIADPAGVQRLLVEFQALTHGKDPSRVVDHIDRLAERVIVATHLPPPLGKESGNKIQRAADWLREHHAEVVDFAELAARHGYSLITFRRHWIRTFGEPPGRSLQRLRMTEACRLLVETNRQIKAIAECVGLPDEFYFSRRFRAETGLPPSGYRQLYRLNR